MTRRSRAVAGLAVAIAVALILPACGYGLAGRNVSLPEHVKVIAIPPFVNRSGVLDIEHALQKAMLQELQSRGRWKVQPDSSSSSVDAVVTGTIVAVNQHSLALNGQKQASQIEIAVTASIEFKDLRDNNKMLWSSPGIVSADQFPVTQGASATDTNAYLRQNGDAVDRLARDFARKVISAMLEGM